LPLVDGIAMGIGAMLVVMLRLPLTSVLLASLLLASDGLAVMPLVIVAVAEGYHLTEDLTDKALEFIKDAKTLAPDKPFFLYYALGAAHAPHHVSKEWADKFKGHFDMGYEAIREQTLARQKKMGIVPADTELPPINPIGTPETRKGPKGQPFPPLDFTRPWDSLSAEEKQLFCRMAEVYAGFLAHADHHIGRLLDYLEESG
jgi:arylsulfatase A-like enzyme